MTPIWRQLMTTCWLCLLLGAVISVLGGVKGVAARDQSSGPPQAKTAPKIIQVQTGAIAAGGWYRGGFDAYEKMAAALGSEPTVLERVGFDIAPQTFRRLGSEGYDIVVLHSSGYAAAALQVAPEFPKTWWIVYSDLSTTNNLKNIAGWAINWSEVGYVAASIACAASKTGTIGMIDSLPIPAMMRWAGGSQQATDESAKVIGKQCEFRIVWTGDNVDPAKARQAALSLLDQGADVLFDAANAAGVGAIEVAKQRGVKYVGGVVDQCQQAPRSVTTSVTMNFDVAYQQMARAFKDGQLEPRIYPLNVANGGIKVLPTFCNPDAKTEARTREVIEKLSRGDITVDTKRTLKPF